jgi:hypothetical protein
MVDAQRVRQSILRAWEKKPICLAAKPRGGSKRQGAGPVATLRKLMNQPVHDVASFLCVPSDLGDAAIDEQFNPSDVTRLNLCEKCNVIFVGPVTLLPALETERRQIVQRRHSRIPRRAFDHILSPIRTSDQGRSGSRRLPEFPSPCHRFQQPLHPGRPFRRPVMNT